MADLTPITDEEIEQVVSEFCSELEGHRQALREIAEYYVEKGRQMVFAEVEKVSKVIDWLEDEGEMGKMRELREEDWQALKGGKDA